MARRLKPSFTGPRKRCCIVDCADPEALRSRIEQDLSRHPQLQYATITLDFVPESNFQRDRARVTALNRARQMRMPTLVYPRSRFSREVCSTDMVRPAFVNGQSPMTHTRREYGRERRQTFYRLEVEKYAGSRRPTTNS